MHNPSLNLETEIGLCSKQKGEAAQYRAALGCERLRQGTLSGVETGSDEKPDGIVGKEQS
jgi:hypothetical protein